MEGYIKLYRKLIESPVFVNEKLLKIWIWCLCRANHSDTETIVGLRKVEVKKGQFVFGLLKASQELQIPKTTLYRNLRTLCEFGMISIKSENKFSIATIENWEKYQCMSVNNGINEENKRKTNGKQTETDKNVKNDKNIYGEFENVKLSDMEVEKLKDRFPKDWEERVEKLSSYMKSKGKSYKSHYATILNWSRREPVKEERKLDWTLPEELRHIDG